MVRHTRTLVLLVGLLPGCATLGGPTHDPPVATHAGTHFRVLCHFDCGAGGVAARNAAEAAWDATASLLGGDPAPSGRPIHLYATEEEYEAVEARLTGGRFRMNRAFSVNGEEAHLAVHPNLSPEALEEFGLTSNTLRVIAHEAAHMAMRALAPRSADVPDWLDEGLATSIELDVLLDLGLAEGRWQEPVSGTRAYLLQDRIERERLPPLGTLLTGGLQELTISERYAFYQLFTDFLRDRYGDRLSTVLRTLDGFRSGRLERALVPALVGAELDDLAAVDAAFRAWVGALEPGWVQARRALTVAGDAWLQVGFDNGAEAWRWPTGALPYTLRGRVRTLSADARPTLLIALPEGAQLAFILGDGVVRVERRLVVGDARPTTLMEAPLGPPRAETAFAVHVSSDGVRAEIGDAELRVAVEPAGRWGLAVGPAGNAVWLDVVVSRTAADSR